MVLFIRSNVLVIVRSQSFVFVSNMLCLLRVDVQWGYLLIVSFGIGILFVRSTISTDILVVVFSEAAVLVIFGLISVPCDLCVY